MYSCYMNFVRVNLSNLKSNNLRRTYNNEAYIVGVTQIIIMKRRHRAPQKVAACVNQNHTAWDTAETNRPITRGQASRSATQIWKFRNVIVQQLKRPRKKAKSYITRRNSWVLIDTRPSSTINSSKKPPDCKGITVTKRLIYFILYCWYLLLFYLVLLLLLLRSSWCRYLNFKFSVF